MVEAIQENVYNIIWIKIELYSGYDKENICEKPTLQSNIYDYDNSDAGRTGNDTVVGRKRDHDYD